MEYKKSDSYPVKIPSLLKMFIMLVYELKISFSDFFYDLVWNNYISGGGPGGTIFLLFARFFETRAVIWLIIWDSIAFRMGW